MITCRTVTELHTAAEEGALTGAQRARYAVHMTICGPCKRYHAQLATTVEVLRGLPKVEPPPGLLDRLAAEISEKS